MATKVTEDIAVVWGEFKKDQANQALRNRLIEKYLPLVRYNAERVWANCPRASISTISSPPASSG
jgi:RNA polymerase sigma factor for flagellar operon FliA